jgi:hypothetical protein
MTKILELLPEGKVTLSWRFLGMIVIAATMVSLGYGEFRSQSTQLASDRTEIHNIVATIEDLKVELKGLQVSMEDLRRSVDQLSSQHGR